MKNIVKNNKESGFLKIILIIVVALLVLSYFHISISQAVNWFVGLFHRVFK